LKDNIGKEILIFMKSLYLITGPSGIGKSTISEIISNKSNCALIEGDTIYHMVQGGFIPAWEEGNHLELFWKNSTDLITNFLNNDFNVVFNYIIMPKDIEYIKKTLKDANVEIKLVVLIANEKTLISRDKTRPVDCQMGERSLILLNEFKKAEFNDNNIFDTSEYAIENIVKEIIEEKRFLI